MHAGKLDHLSTGGTPEILATRRGFGQHAVGTR